MFERWTYLPNTTSRLQRSQADFFRRLFLNHLTVEQHRELSHIIHNQATYADAFLIIGTLMEMEKLVHKYGRMPSKKRFQMRLVRVLLERMDYLD